MKSDSHQLCILLAFVVKFVFSFILTNSLKISFLYVLVSTIFYAILIKNKKKIDNFISYVMIEYIFVFYIVYLKYDINIITLLISIGAYTLNNFMLFTLIINDIIDYSTKKVSYDNSTRNIDNGLKALENEDYDKALEHFSNAIKNYKKNYLGYMGMCNTLSRMDKKYYKQLKYYKNKCIKYAPKELKQSIIEKYK